MNIKIALNLLLLLLIPACGFRRSARVSYPLVEAPVVSSTDISTQVIEAEVNNIKPDEEIDAFILEDDTENPFATHLNLQKSDQEELNLVHVNASSGDAHEDSAKYGLKNIYFNFNQYKLRPDQNLALEHNYQVIKDLIDKNYTISLEGHACNFAGDTNYNMMLSEDRARAVADYLTRKGIDASKLHAVGFGSTRPLVPQGNKEQQSPNRRVEIYAYKNN